MANRDAEPGRIKDEISEIFAVTQLDNLLVIATELKSQLNNLRQDFRRHDHGTTASYAGASYRINGSDNTPSGVETAVVVAARVPDQWYKKRG